MPQPRGDRGSGESNPPPPKRQMSCGGAAAFLEYARSTNPVDLDDGDLDTLRLAQAHVQKCAQADCPAKKIKKKADTSPAESKKDEEEAADKPAQTPARPEFKSLGAEILSKAGISPSLLARWFEEAGEK